MLILVSGLVFFSAFLLFWVQLMVGKLVLPLLGGSPAVWNTCLLFFQMALLLGYSYANWLSQWRSFAQQRIGYLLFWGLAALSLPIGLRFPVLSIDQPILWLLAVLTLTVGLPFVCLAITAPLFQRWFSLHAPSRDPYFLYVASNAGSLLGLLGYPLLLEPLLSLTQQRSLWSWGYGLLALGIGVMMLNLKGSPARADQEKDPAGEGDPSPPPTWRERWRWGILAAIPSSLLLGVTTYLTTDIAAIPLLWAIPLALYLATFMAVFGRDPHWPSAIWTGILPGLVTLVLGAQVLNIVRPAGLLLPLHLLTFGVATWNAHAQLARLRPSATYLTEFYLWIALGGGVGGIFNAIVAPLLFNSVVEYPFALLLSVLLLSGWSAIPRFWRGIPPLSLGLLVPVLLLGWDPSSWQQGWIGRLLVIGLGWGISQVLRIPRWAQAIGAGLLLLLLSQPLIGLSAEVVDSQRSFFGLYRVVESAQPADSASPTPRWRRLLHGTTLHGMVNLDQPTLPLTYFTQAGPVGQLFAARPQGSLTTIGVLGLGIGTLMAYATPQQSWTFFEIDPLVEELARHYFPYLSQAEAAVEVIVGDGRLSLEASTTHYDWIVLDAFSSDAVPVHLLTHEALQIYQAHLNPHGWLIFNITNRYLELAPLLARLAAQENLWAWHQGDLSLPLVAQQNGHLPSEWVVMASPEDADLARLASDSRWQRLTPQPTDPLWTDDYSNLWGVLRWGNR
ncbi:MAG: fused MFS/spermidine synthase [Cyanobacteriota bacterium]|nr:fused MFS/spermidine synthase [Cyanobacteriota bacterium]